VARTDSPDTAESLESSQPTGEKSTRKTRNITPEQALEILQQAVINCQHAGIIASIGPYYSYGQQSVVIVLANCQLIDGKLVSAD
jgi:hypothetical protein